MKPALRVEPEVLGARLRAARVVRQITQDASARAMKMARTTIVAIESGKRKVSPDELRAFASLYLVPESTLLSTGERVIELQMQYRGTPTAKPRSEEREVSTLMHRLAHSLLELEELLDVAPPVLDVPYVTIRRDSPIRDQAEDAAVAVRARLGLGVGPVQDLNTLLESELGIRVFERPLPSNVSGAVAWSNEWGAFLLLNSKHPMSRRRVTAGHELAHIALRQAGLTVHLENESHESKEERFCDLFAIAFLMPAMAVRRKVAELKSVVEQFTVRELLILTLHFNVSMEALVRRMVSLGTLKEGTYERLRADGLTLKHLEQVRTELGMAEEPSQFTSRTMLLAIGAHRRDLLTEQQIASMLELDLLSVRTLLNSGLRPGQEEALDLVS